MFPPRYKRPRHSLTPKEVARLVALREAGATWKAIGRVFNKQDGACRAAYQAAVRARRIAAE